MERRRKLPLGSLFVTVISLFVFVIPMIRGFISNQENRSRCYYNKYNKKQYR